MEISNIINFGAGPAKLPKEVLEEIQTEMICYQKTGMSITELSHRSSEYAEINSRAQNTLRELLNIPPNYRVLFVAGGGQGAFAAIPMNLMGSTSTADYIVTGIWSKIAAEEAKNHGEVNIAATANQRGTIPEPETWKVNPKASYVFYVDNDTIEGVEFPFIPETNGVPLVADMSSNILTKQIDVSKFGIIFAASQKNLGTAGIAVLIIREELLGSACKYCPNILNFTLLNEYSSILNTPPVFSIYVLDKVLQWVKERGGVAAMEALCYQKSQLIYDVLDNSESFYYSFAEKSVRSRINVSFRIGSSEGNETLEKKFLDEAATQNMVQLKGHRLVGGIRVSLFNSITVEEVMSLVKFMSGFEAKYKIAN